MLKCLIYFDHMNLYFVELILSISLPFKMSICMWCSCVSLGFIESSLCIEGDVGRIFVPCENYYSKI